MTPFYKYKVSKSNTNILVVGSIENTFLTRNNSACVLVDFLDLSNNNCKNLFSCAKVTPAFLGLTFHFLQ